MEQEVGEETMGCLVLKETRGNLDHLDLKESEANRYALLGSVVLWCNAFLF